MLFFTQRRTNFKVWLKVILLSLGLLVGLGSYLTWQLVVPAGSGDNLVVFTIKSGQGVKEIGYNLRQVQMVRSGFWFESWVWLTNTEKRFMAGEYRLSPDTNLVNLVRLLTGGARPASEITVTIVEGWTRQQIGEYLQTVGLVPAANFSSQTKSFNQATAKLRQAGSKIFVPQAESISLEGYLFPDTYRLYRDASSQDLIDKMLNNFSLKFKPSWLDKITAQGYSVHEVVTLASIVEREVSSQADRALVADIFWRRLKAGRGLEADSTINYITGKKTPSASLTDLKLNSPYNTYRYRGLPPGPISNPGEAALQATVYPTANQYWYFLTTPSGQAIYSQTFEEHKAAKQKYLR